jgi:outer membrane receptor protein involved in Fe transport
LKINTMRERLLASSMIGGVALLGLSATQAAAQQAQSGSEVSEIVVTGSRIVRQDYVATSPIATVTGEQLQSNADITLDTYLNNLPQVVPSGTTTSNNPGNGGQSNIDLRGLGPNRNIVLIDGRRAMPSSNDLTVDLNTIPAALIQNVEVITGGAGAAYGADAIAGAVNIRLKTDFQGLDMRMTYQNSTEFWDAEEFNFSLVAGGNFADGKGNAVIAFDRSTREGMIKSQRKFSQNATSTTSFLPEGNLFWAGTNAPSLAALQGVFAKYGVAPGNIALSSGTLGFNLDGTMFYRGVFNNPLNVQNFRYPVDGQVNQRLYPDVYSYNFDFVNILALPLDRYSLMSKLNYKFDNDIEIFANMGWTQYVASTALAPTPFPTVNTRNACDAGPTDVVSALVTCGSGVAQQIVIPTTNPFIPTDLRTLLNSRAGNDPGLTGAGATEAFRMRQRTLGLGLRESKFTNTVVQFMAGIRGPVGDTGWDFEAYVSEGRTEIGEQQLGGLDTQRLQTLLEAPDGGASICAGGFNIFGRQPISAACADYLEVSTLIRTMMKQQVGQAFVRGPLMTLPAGQVQAVAGVEYRGFEYQLDPGAASGPLSGPNTQNPDEGNNEFKDIFGELLIPLVKDLPFAKSVELNVGARYSQSDFTDKINGIKVGPRGSWAYKAEIDWQIVDPLRARMSYQRSVREPNFSELFSGGGSAPQYFDPCSITSQFRQGGGAQAAALCQNAGFNGGVAAGSINNYVQTPGSQIGVDLLGNTSLDPEVGDTFTAGIVWRSPWDNQWLSRLQGSVDYYRIKVKDAILTPTPNQIVAACYNYYGTNPTMDANDEDCQGILRTGTDILWVYNPATDFAEFTADNGGKIDTSGVDVQVDWGFDWGWLGHDSWGAVRANLLVTYLIDFKTQDPISGVPEIDFAGTANYFGGGLAVGQSFPKLKATANVAWDVGPFGVNVRGRFIDGMENRLNLEFPGETEFTGPDSVWYWDIAGNWKMTDNVEFRLGVNNVFDKQAESYNPNVQSGTDPSTYDVVGRRVFGTIRLRF